MRRAREDLAQLHEHGTAAPSSSTFLLLAAYACELGTATFPTAARALVEIVSELLREFLGPTLAYAQILIEIQFAYINTSHPSFATTTTKRLHAPPVARHGHPSPVRPCPFLILCGCADHKTILGQVVRIRRKLEGEPVNGSSSSGHVGVGGGVEDNGLSGLVPAWRHCPLSAYNDALRLCDAAIRVGAASVRSRQQSVAATIERKRFELAPPQFAPEATGSPPPPPPHQQQRQQLPHNACETFLNYFFWTEWTWPRCRCVGRQACRRGCWCWCYGFCRRSGVVWAGRIGCEHSRYAAVGSVVGGEASGNGQSSCVC